MKSYTSKEQAKKLAEFLPLESADMRFEYILPRKSDKILHYPTVGNPIETLEMFNKGYTILGSKPLSLDEYCIPCWSLAALLQVLPLGIYDELDDCDYELEINMIDKMPRYIRLGDIYHSQFPYDFEKDTLLDNIVESIIWLNDNNYFEL